jgi:hypothetical protein
MAPAIAETVPPPPPRSSSVLRHRKCRPRRDATTRTMQTLTSRAGRRRSRTLNTLLKLVDRTSIAMLPSEQQARNRAHTHKNAELHGQSRRRFGAGARVGWTSRRRRARRGAATTFGRLASPTGGSGAACIARRRVAPVGHCGPEMEERDAETEPAIADRGEDRQGSQS